MPLRKVVIVLLKDFICILRSLKENDIFHEDFIKLEN